MVSENEKLFLVIKWEAIKYSTINWKDITLYQKVEGYILFESFGINLVLDGFVSSIYFFLHLFVFL